jgi:hypothetical protein
MFRVLCKSINGKSWTGKMSEKDKHDKTSVQLNGKFLQ